MFLRTIGPCGKDAYDEGEIGMFSFAPMISQ